MSIGQILLIAFIFGVPLLAIVPVVIKLRQRRKYAYFRVVDEKTGAPLAGAEVSLVSGHEGRSVVSSNNMVVALSPHSTSESRIGKLDAHGAFKRTFGAMDSALIVRGTGVNAGTIGLESVSEYLAFPAEPYVCVVRGGMIVPPAKMSPLTLGLAPGQVLKMREGYINLYEAPTLHDVWACWPTLEEAKANNQNGAFARYWHVSGADTEMPTSLGGNSFSISVHAFKDAP